MSEHAVNDYIRLIGSISLPQSDKERIEKALINHFNTVKKEIPKKYVVAASAVAVVAVGVFLAAREMRQDYRL